MEGGLYLGLQGVNNRLQLGRFVRHETHHRLCSPNTAQLVHHAQHGVELWADKHLLSIFSTWMMTAEAGKTSSVRFCINTRENRTLVITEHSPLILRQRFCTRNDQRLSKTTPRHPASALVAFHVDDEAGLLRGTNTSVNALCQRQA